MEFAARIQDDAVIFVWVAIAISQECGPDERHLVAFKTRKIRIQGIRQLVQLAVALEFLVAQNVNDGRRLVCIGLDIFFEPK